MNTNLTFDKIQQVFIPIKNIITDLNEKLNRLDIDILDSAQFVATLERRVRELDT